MARLEPFENSPRIAVAVSGGADSLCLGLLADAWARARGGSVLALIVDHGLRAASGDEARTTAATLSELRIEAKILLVTDLAWGSAMAARAREARYAALRSACAEAGILHLLLGHHAADQAETVLIRALAASGAAGMAGMARLVEMSSTRLLRPLLVQPPGRLRATLRERGVKWIEDPSNRDPSALRPRLRALRHDRQGAGSATAALIIAANDAGHQRRTREAAIAAFLARHVTLRPEGFAVLPNGPVPPDVLAALVRTISAARYPPPGGQIAAHAADPRPATFAGVRLMRWRHRTILLREANAMAPPVAAGAGAVWDGRFRLRHAVAPGLHLGPLGATASGLRHLSDLPAAVLGTLPALREGHRLVAVPHLRHPALPLQDNVAIWFVPPNPVCGAPFLSDG